MSSQSSEDVEKTVIEFLQIFSEPTEDENKSNVNCFQVNSKKTLEKINDLVDKYKKRHPKLNALRSFFLNLKEGEGFFFLPNIELDQISEIKLSNYLYALAEGVDSEKSNTEFDNLFGKLLKKYTINAYGENRTNIGQKEKDKRVCRFCGKSKPLVTFENKAHAISEALGNKTLVLFEECDVCNSKFSKEIEQDIIEYLSLYRSFYGVKGKGGTKNFEGKNFNIKSGDTPVFGIKGEVESDEFSLPITLNLKTRKPIVLQNIYKILCKYFLSLIDNKELQYFSKTIDWINGDIICDKLPIIRDIVSYHSFSKQQPKLITYIRKNDDKTLPFAVGEFYFTCFVFVFIVPLSSKDTIDFIDKDDFKKFWKTFKHLNSLKNWSSRNFSSNTPKAFEINLNIDLNNKLTDD